MPIQRKQKDQAAFVGGLLMIAALGTSLLGCDAYNHKTAKYRIKPFFELLNESQRTTFEQGELDELSKTIAQQLEADNDFKERWKKVMLKEAIPFLSVKNQLRFFHEYFYTKLSTKSKPS